MSFTEGSSDGTSNNTTAVTVVSAPASSTRRLVKNITVYNNDTVSATVTVQLLNNATARIICKQTLSAGDTLSYTDIIVLDATTKSVQLKLAGAVTTNQLDFTSHYADAT